MQNNILIFQTALDYLEQIKPASVVLNKYFLGDSRDYSSLKDIYLQFIGSAQNYQGMPKIIQFSKRKDAIAKLLFDYDHTKIKDMSVEDLYQSFRTTFQIGGADNNYNS